MLTKEIPLSVVDNLINLMYETDCIRPDQTPRDLMGHTGMDHVESTKSQKAMDYYNEILEPLIGYKPNSHGRYGCYVNPIPIHNDGLNYLGSRHMKSNYDFLNARPANTTVFFPLRVFGNDGKEGGKTSTIYFDQMDPSTHKAGKQPITDEESFYVLHGHYGWNIKHDYSDLVNYTNQPFDPDIHGRYLKQHPIDNLFGFSFKEEVEWEIGTVVFFETARIHCSKYFTDCVQKDCFLVKVNTDLFPELN